MQNAHLRLGLLEYHRITEKTSTRIRVRVSSYIGEDEQAHLDRRLRKRLRHWRHYRGSSRKGDTSR